MNKGKTLALLYGLASALPLALAMLWPSGLLFWFLVPLPLFVCGLSMGAGAVLLSAVTTQTALALILVWLSLAANGSLAAAVLDGAGLFVGLTVMLGAPVVILVRQALLNRQADDGTTEWYPSGLLVTWLTGLGIVLLGFSLASIALFGGAPDGIEAAATEQLFQVLQTMLVDAPEDELRRVAATAAPISLGLGLDGWLIVLALNGGLAQGLLGRYGRNLRPAPRLGDMTLPAWPALTLAGAALVGIFAGGDLAFVANSLALLLILPFFFAGLAVVHAACRRLKSGTVVLVVFYMVLVLIAWPAVLVVLAGLVDQWIGLRRRLAPPAGKQEKE